MRLVLERPPLVGVFCAVPPSPRLEPAETPSGLAVCVFCRAVLHEEDPLSHLAQCRPAQRARDRLAGLRAWRDRVREGLLKL